MSRLIAIDDVSQAAPGDSVVLCAVVRSIVPADEDLPAGLLKLRVLGSGADGEPVEIAVARDADCVLCVIRVNDAPVK
jgi:hypothetical protein